MKYMNVILICLLIFVLFISCSTRIKKEQLDKDSITLKINTSIKLRYDVRLIIEECINRYPQYDSFLLTRSPQKLNEDTQNGIICNDFLIGPAYSQVFRDKTPLLYFELKDRVIFVKCGLEELYSDSQYQDSVFHSQQIKRGLDSMINDMGWVIKNGKELYVHRSIYFNINKDGSVSKNYRPDTLIIPKLVPSTVKFDPNIR
jgi:hypothetical protein